LFRVYYRGMVKDVSIEGAPREFEIRAEPSSIWYRQTANGEKTGPFTVDQVLMWYDLHQILISAQFSFDDGHNWKSIVELLRTNSPSQPFVEINETQNARKMVSDARLEVHELEKQVEIMKEKLIEEEKLLEKMRRMDKLIDSGFTKEDYEEFLENGVNAATVGPNDLPPFDGTFTLFRFDNGEIWPIGGVDPFADLDPLNATSIKLHGDVTILSSELANLINVRGREKLANTTRACIDSESRLCKLCNIEIVAVYSFIQHITGRKHVNNMKEKNILYGADSYNFWKEVIEFSRIDQGEQKHDEKATSVSPNNLPSFDGKFTLFRFENEEIRPIDGVDPFADIDPLNATSSTLRGDVTIQSCELANLLNI
ncbi:hypothetical protein PFISCL1PPCAC_6751, partial [Pristionchus fissidentatus]